jgi:hypothetical protein
MLIPPSCLLYFFTSSYMLTSKPSRATPLLRRDFEVSTIQRKSRSLTIVWPLILVLILLLISLLIHTIFQAETLKLYRIGEKIINLQNELQSCKIENVRASGELEMARELKDKTEKENHLLLETRARLLKRVDAVEEEVGICKANRLSLEEEVCRLDKENHQLSGSVRSLKEQLESKENEALLSLVRQMGTGGYVNSQICKPTDFWS